ncbi:MAG: nucleotidyltransferase domain-containing protein [Egibacteraceae bacterium]
MVTVVWGRAHQRAALLAEELARFTGELQALSGVEAAWVFGSALDGDVQATSDLGLLVVRVTDEPFLDRSLTLRRELEPRAPVDVFVYTPAELAEGGRFIRHALTTGRRLW